MKAELSNVNRVHTSIQESRTNDEVILMGWRYLVSSTQLGVIKGLVSGSMREQEVNKLLDEIFEKQFIMNSNRDIASDVNSMIEMLGVM